MYNNLTIYGDNENVSNTCTAFNSLCSLFRFTNVQTPLNDTYTFVTKYSEPVNKITDFFTLYPHCCFYLESYDDINKTMRNIVIMNDLKKYIQ